MLDGITQRLNVVCLHRKTEEKISHKSVSPIVTEWIVSSLRKQVDGIQEEAQTLRSFKEQGDLPAEAVHVYQEMLGNLTTLDSVLSRLERSLSSHEIESARSRCLFLCSSWDYTQGVDGCWADIAAGLDLH